jgi:hypothetical protein
MRISSIVTAPTLALLLVAGCGPAEEAPPATSDLAADVTPAAQAVAAADGSAGALSELLVYKTPSCGCCNGWVDHLRDHEYAVETRDVRSLMGVKTSVGLPVELASCHTAIVEGYVVEGHVPAAAIDKLLAERPEIAGLAVPGMPIGSPGMEGPNPEPYTVYAFLKDGTTTEFMTVDPR